MILMKKDNQRSVHLNYEQETAVRQPSLGDRGYGDCLEEIRLRMAKAILDQ